MKHPSVCVFILLFTIASSFSQNTENDTIWLPEADNVIKIVAPVIGWSPVVVLPKTCEVRIKPLGLVFSDDGHEQIEGKKGHGKIEMGSNPNRYLKFKSKQLSPVVIYILVWDPIKKRKVNHE